jgi:hypothetical protein
VGTGTDALGDRRADRVPVQFVAGLDIGDVHLDGVDNDGIGGRAHRLDEVDQRAHLVRLVKASNAPRLRAWFRQFASISTSVVVP